LINAKDGEKCSSFVKNFGDMFGKKIKFDNLISIIEDNGFVSSSLISNNHLVSCSNDKSIKIWDFETLECKETLLDTEPIHALIKLNDNHFLSFHRYNLIQLWDFSQKLCVDSFYSTDLIHSYHCVRLISGIKLARAHYEYIKIWDLGYGNELTLKGHRGWIYDLVVIPEEQRTNQSWLASCSSDKKIKIWSNQGDCLKTLKGHTNGIICLCLLYNGNLASGSLDKTIKIWTLELETCILTLKGHKRGVTSLVTNKTRELFSASIDGQIKIWNLEMNVCLKTLEGHIGSVRNLKLWKDYLISCSSDKTMKIWNLKRGECERTFFGHTDVINNFLVF
jgi:WD40 repeat protein